MTEYREEERVEGTIGSVVDHGGIVIVWHELEDGRNQPIYLDHRASGRVVEGEGVECPVDLIGRPVLYNGETINFLDSLEAA